jgi:hypothetical protein
MTRQTKRPGSEMDFGLLSPCPVNAGWYQRYWYGDNSSSRLSFLLTPCDGSAGDYPVRRRSP